MDNGNPFLYNGNIQIVVDAKLDYNEAIRKVVAGLLILEKCDRRRIGRVERYVSTIFVSQATRSAYLFAGRLSVLNFEDVTVDLRSPVIIAEILAWHGTQGLLREKGFPCFWPVSRRLRQVCSKEQSRFVKEWAAMTQ